MLTIGIPIKNRAYCIQEVLRAIESIDYPKEKIKLVFVDDYSTDGTFEILAKWKSKMEGQYYNIVLIRERTNIPEARNLCIKHMEGDYLLFWDSDVVPPEDLLKEMVMSMEANSHIGIIGADYIYENATGIRHKPILNKETHATYMGFALIRKEVFNNVGGFNENLSIGEDTEFCIRVREKTNYKIVWAPKPVLHLKKPQEVRKKGLFKAWVKYNFDVRAKEYCKSFDRLPKFLKARILYYIGLPWVIATSIIVSATGVLPAISIAFMYLIPSLYLVIKQMGPKEGVATWVKFNLPTGLALSYGMLWVTIRRFAKALSSTFKALR